MYNDCMRTLRGQGQMGSKIYDAVCELSRRKNYRRNQSAMNMMNTFVKKSLKASTLASSWWECFSDNNTARCESVDQLIIIFDEVGKIPAFALGLVDEVRHLLIDIHNKRLAKDIILVLVGSGLDGYLKRTIRNTILCQHLELTLPRLCGAHIY
jgi:hypothetical protein